MTQLVLTYEDPKTLRPAAGNARTHPRRQIKELEASIAENGFTNPILRDEKFEVIAGHGRLIAAKNLGLSLVPTIELSGLSEIQKQVLRIADNKIAQNAGWDVDILKIELTAIFAAAPEISIASLGFSSGELDVTLATPKDCADDEAPEPPLDPTSTLGDIWLLGHHRLGCGDCRDSEFLAKLVAGMQADAAFLDPPYNVKIGGFAVTSGTHREFPLASGEMTPSEFRAFLTDCLGACVAVSKSGAVHFVCLDHRHVEDFADACGSVYGERLNICVWNKSNAGMGSLYRSKHEFVLVMKVGDAPHFNAVELGKHGRNRANVWDYPSVNSFKGSRRDDLSLHPTTKPVQLVADAIQDVTRRNDVVLDCFIGSGTSLIACERTGRRFVGLDLDPGYVDVCIERWETLTGLEAVHEASGQTFGQRRRELQYGGATDHG